VNVSFWFRQISSPTEPRPSLEGPIELGPVLTAASQVRRCVVRATGAYTPALPGLHRCSHP
jgi:hypothetical protein